MLLPVRLRTFRQKPAFPSGKKSCCDRALSLSLLQCSYAEPGQLSLVKNTEPSGPKSILGVKWYVLPPACITQKSLPILPKIHLEPSLPSEVRLVEMD